jgi:hypothetical protein
MGFLAFCCWGTSIALAVSGVLLRAPCFALSSPSGADLPLLDQGLVLRCPASRTRALNLESGLRAPDLIGMEVSAASIFSMN